MFAYCLNNPVIHSDSSGYIAIVDDVFYAYALGVCVAAVVISSIPLVCGLISELYKAFVSFLQATSESAASDNQAEQKRRSLPFNGTPNSDDDLEDEDGSIKQTRHYGDDGKPEYDIDYHHQDDGTHVFPHVHPWKGGVRSKTPIPLDEFLVIN